MATLILVRHSISRQQPGISAHLWQLTDEGIARCKVLAEQLKAYRPAVIVTSAEPKAQQTGALLAEILGTPLETEADLHEQLRKTAPYSANEADFKARIRELFAKPDELVFGEETANQARARFRHSIDAILSRHPGQNVAAVTHGTVLSLFVSQVANLDPVAFWESLGMPAYLVFDLPDFRLTTIRAML
jgi:broad specificity phosphatase PhoE